MAKKTLLEIVQSSLSNIGSDDINSINDTEESYDAAVIAKEVYESMMALKDWPHLREAANLVSVSDTDTPTHLKLNTVHQEIDVETFYYDKKITAGGDPEYERVYWCRPEEFLRIVLPRGSNLSDSNIVEVTSPIKFYIYNDRAPTYFTSFDDEFIVCDSYDSDVDTTLVGTKSAVMAYKEATFTLSDTFTPDLPSKSVPQYLAEVKAAVAFAIGQEADVKQESIARGHSKENERRKWRAHDGSRRPDYGRKGRYGRK